MATSHLRLIDGQSGYREILRYVVSCGMERSPRGMKTLDVGYTTLEFITPYNMLPIGIGRQLSKRVAAAEAIQLIGGFADPQLLLQASPNFQRYIEPNGEFWGAYGRRIGTQLAFALDKLRVDPDTRQAIITLWQPGADNEIGRKDYPCTIALGFSIIRGHVELDVTMRSNDVWRGLPYDIFQFTQLQHTVANLLGRQVGPYRHHTYSLHVYEDDADLAYEVGVLETPVIPSFQPTGFGNQTGLPLSQAMAHARLIARGEPIFTFELDESERWYYDALHPAK